MGKAQLSTAQLNQASDIFTHRETHPFTSMSDVDTTVQVPLELVMMMSSVPKEECPVTLQQLVSDIAKFCAGAPTRVVASGEAVLYEYCLADGVMKSVQEPLQRKALLKRLLAVFKRHHIHYSRGSKFRHHLRVREFSAYADEEPLYPEELERATHIVFCTPPPRAQSSTNVFIKGGVHGSVGINLGSTTFVYSGVPKA